MTDADKALLPEHWIVRNGGQIIVQPVSKPDWVIEGLLLKDSATLVSGHPHSCKSLNWLCAAMESVTTHQVWGHFPSPKVECALYIETEDPAAVVENRVQQFAIGLCLDAADLENFYLVNTGPFDIVASEPQLQRLLADVRPDWFVLSTLQGLLNGRDWKEQSSMSEVNAVMVRLSRLCPLVLITHSPWDKTARRAAGSVTQAANFLTTMHMTKTVKDHVIITQNELDSKMAEDLPAFRLILETEQVGGVSEVRRVSYEGLSVKAQILAHLARHPRATPQQIAAAAGCSERYVRTVLKGMEQRNSGASRPPTVVPHLPKGTGPEQFSELALQAK